MVGNRWEKMALIKSKKHVGVFYNELKNGDKVYYVVYKDLATNNRIDLKIGKKSEGITELYCYNKRSEILNNMRLGTNPHTVKNRRIAVDITTLDMIADEYYANRKIYMSEVNWKDSVSIYNNHIKPYLGNKNIEEITSSDIEQIMVEKKGQLANKTINIIVEKIGTIFYYAIKKKIFKGTNPLLDIKKLPESNNRIRFLSKEEIALLLDATKKHPDKAIHIFTYLALTTGARLVGICNLKIQDVDFRHNVITVYDFKNKTNYNSFLRDDTEFTTLLKNHIKGRNVLDFLLGERTLIGHRRFIQRELSSILDKLFNVDYLNNVGSGDKELEAEKRRNKVVIHTLRHTFASQLVINGTPIFTVQKLMNHKDIKMTMRYAKLSPDSGRNSVDGIF
jgi:integrase